MFFHIQSFHIVLKAHGFSVSLIWSSSMLNNFASLYLKPKYLNLGFSGFLKSLFVIFLIEYLFTPIFVHF